MNNRKCFLILMALLILTSCTRKVDPPQETPPLQEQPTAHETPAPGLSSSAIEEYFPLKANTLFDYQGIGSEAAGQQIYNTYINGATVQRYMLSGGGHRLTEVLTVEQGQVTVIYADVSNYYIEDLTDIAPQMKTILLKEPLQLGTKWESDQYGGISEITSMAAEVETPYGTFEAIEVSTLTTVGTMVYAEQNYYAKGVGLVKAVYGSESSATLGCELASIKQDTGVSLPYYYFNPVVTDTDYERQMEARELEITTNGDIAKSLTAQFQTSSNEEVRPVMAANTKINSITTERDNNRLTADFSKEFISEMNAGAGQEQNILQAVADTLGNLYRVGQVRITVDGAAYESGHITMDLDEYMTVDTQGGQE